MRLRDLLRLVRPHQAPKNLIVLAPLLFSGHLLDPAAGMRGLVALAGFILCSFAVYAANDAVDAEADRRHPTKRHRPVAAGALAPGTASALAALLAATGLATLFFLNRTTGLLGAAYVVLQLGYMAWLKHLFLWDTLAIAAGFVLRALGGTTAIEVGPPTVWLIVCTFLFAFHLALGKRRREARLGTTATRTTLAHYTEPFLAGALPASTAMLLVAYALYIISGPRPAMLVTLPFAFYGVLRFDWLLLAPRPDRDETTLVLRDPASLTNAAAWILAVLAAQSSLPAAIARWAA